VLLGAILAPTDPVLASEVRSDPGSDADRLGVSLAAEGGLNDGAAFPFVVLGFGRLGLQNLGPIRAPWPVSVAWAMSVQSLRSHAPARRSSSSHAAALPDGTAPSCSSRARSGKCSDGSASKRPSRTEQAPMAVPALLHAQRLVDAGADLAIPAGPGGEALWAEARLTLAPLITLMQAAPDALPITACRATGEGLPVPARPPRPAGAFDGGVARTAAIARLSATPRRAGRALRLRTSRPTRAFA
jgi:hypothetical protein